ncbi:MAG: transglycosylase domain-containing protein [Bacteroidia bacterium]
MAKRLLILSLLGTGIFLGGIGVILVKPDFFLRQAILFYARRWSIDKVRFATPQWRAWQLYVPTLELYALRYYVRCDSITLGRKKISMQKLLITPSTEASSPAPSQSLIPKKFPTPPPLPQTLIDTIEIRRKEQKIFFYHTRWKKNTLSTHWQWETNQGLMEARWHSDLAISIFPLKPLRYKNFYLKSDTLRFRLEPSTLRATVGSIAFFHPQVSTDTLKWEVPPITLTWQETQDSLHLSAYAEHLSHPQAILRLHKKPLCATFTVHINRTTPKNFLTLFPQNFFDHLSQFQYAGEMEIDFIAAYDARNPDSLYLDAVWKTYNLHITHYSKLCIPCYNQPFSYTPYGERLTFEIGESNPNFILLRQIPPYVLLSVLHGEDGNFFYHRGFHAQNLGKAMVENWRCKCMRRGASTITMQVVRNLFLTRRKTLSRKVEEIFLTALIERFRLLSKERILEIYFNIAEWGPGIYGIVAASQFYFRKNPHQLTIPESIFLGLLLPAPKKYRYHFVDSTLCLKDIYKGYLQHIGGFLVRQKYLSPDSLETLSPEQVCLQGPAKNVFLRDSLLK